VAFPYQVKTQRGLATTKKIETGNGVRKGDMGMKGDEGDGCTVAGGSAIPTITLISLSPFLTPTSRRDLAKKTRF
jgi:hypothetical protein